MFSKTLGMTIGYIFVFAFIAIIGICFSAFIDTKNQIEVKAISILCDDGIVVHKKGDENKAINTLKVMSPKVGAKPATGDLDVQTQIPHTITDKVGSEGAYACFAVKSSIPYYICLASVKNVPEVELDNVKISFDGDNSKTFSMKDIGVPLIKSSDNEKGEFVVFVWLDAKTSKNIVGSKIEIELKVVADSKLL